MMNSFFMEITAHKAVGGPVALWHSSVGVLVNIRHLAPTPLWQCGSWRSEVVEVDGYKVMFHVQVWTSELAGGTTPASSDR